MCLNRILREEYAKRVFSCLILATFFCGFLSAQSGGGRQITYSCQEEQLAEALRQVERLSGYYKMQFAYEDVEPYRVSVNLKNASMRDALDALLKRTSLRYEANDRFIQIFAVKKYKSKGSVRGIVVDETGEPLPGVAVRDRANNRATVTDIDGNFTIPCQEDHITLHVTYIGKKALTVKARNGQMLELAMEDDSKVLKDVVVTGYQQLDRRNLTSSVVSVDMDEIEIPGISSVDKMLEGKIPDLVLSTNSGEINATPRIRVRGTSTLIGNREPLWVVDGIIVTDPVDLSPDVLNDPDYVNRIGNAIAGINPQDIQRIDVLKDAAAAALYGTRAANGVIVITTKSGREGRPIVSYTGNFTVRKRPYYTDRKINLMDSKERIQFSRDLIDLHYIYPSGMPLVGYEAALQNLYSGIYTPAQFDAEVAAMETRNTDWFDLLCHNSFSHDHSVSVSGGSDKVRYYTSVGYTDQDDVINHTINRRYTALAKINIKVNTKIDWEINLNGYLNDREYGQSEVNPINYAYNTSRTIAAFNPDGSYAFYQKPNYNVGTYEATDRRYMNFNILSELENSYQKQTVSSVTATSNLRYKPIEDLFFNWIMSVNTSNSEIEGWWGERSCHVGLLRGSEYGTTPPADSQLPYGGILNTNTNRNKGWTMRLQGNYNKWLGKDRNHNINIAAGVEASSTQGKGYSREDRGYFQDRGKSFMVNVPEEYTQYVTWLRNNQPTITDTRDNIFSAYATLSYSFGNYFTANVNGRYDGSNKFGSRSNEKLLPIWSVSGNARLMEIFGIQASWINDLTLKASYGEQGNMLDGQLPVMTLQKGSLNAIFNEFESKVVNFANPDLRWEKTKSTNVGLESSFFGGRLQVGAEYYYKKTTDAFMEKPISDINGYESYVVNSGVITNTGFNVSLSATPVKAGKFYWILSGNVSRVWNKVETAPGAETYELEDFLDGTAVVDGYPVGTFWSYKFLGLNPMDGGPLFEDWEDRAPEVANKDKYYGYTRLLVPTGQRDPDVTGSINNTFTYKEWRLGFSLLYNFGARTRLFRLYDDIVNGYSSEANVNRDLLSRWKEPGDEFRTNLPALLSPYSDAYFIYNRHYTDNGGLYNGPQLHVNAYTRYDYSDVRTVNAGYVKLSSLYLTYEFNNKLLKRWHMSRLALTLSAYNLYTFCDKRLKGQTPTQGGFSDVQLSDTPSFTFGISADF